VPRVGTGEEYGLLLEPISSGNQSPSTDEGRCLDIKPLPSQSWILGMKNDRILNDFKKLRSKPSFLRRAVYETARGYRRDRSARVYLCGDFSIFSEFDL
jgi:hypothetical protein